MSHRLFAVVLVALLAVLAWRLWIEHGRTSTRPAAAVAGLALWQVLSGLSNVILGWPLVAALAHAAGAAALVAVTVSLWARGQVQAENTAVGLSLVTSARHLEFPR